MTIRSWMLAVAMVSLMVGGVWAGLALANARNTKAGDGLSEAKVSVPTKDVKVVGTKAVDCCDDLTCPPGCSEACPPDCLDLTAKANTKPAAKSSCCSDGECCATTPTRSTKPPVAKKDICPPCPFCPGW